jgi:predicted Zn-dependent protease
MTRLRKAALAGALLCAVAAAARAEGEGFYGPLPLKDSELQLMKNADATEDQFVRHSYRYEAPELEGALKKIGGALAPKPTDTYIRYRFFVVRDIETNAFALPDGQVYVNSGLLAGLENEAQLAGVLAHEVHHTAGHHGILSYRSARRKVIAGSILGPLTLGVGDYFLAMSVFGYSRDLEEEADRLGLKRMLTAGYDPRQVPRMLQILAQDPEGETLEMKSSKWSTHPALMARIDYTQAMLPGVMLGHNSDSLKVNAQGYRVLVRRASLDTVQDLIAADQPRTAVTLAQRLLKEDADPAALVALGDARCALGPVALLGGEAELTNKQKMKTLRLKAYLTRSEREAKLLETQEGRDVLRRNLDLARQSYQRALAIDGSAAEAHRGLGYVFSRVGRPIDAGKEFVIYLKARPQAPDKPVILGEMKAINATLKNGGAKR